MIKTIAAPSPSWVDLDTAKKYLRIDDSTQDSIITGLIAQCQQEAEKISGYALSTQTLQADFMPEDALQRYPTSFAFRWSKRVYRLPFPPFQSLVFLKRLQSDETWETLVESTDFDVISDIEPCEIILQAPTKERILIQWIAGYTDPSQISPSLVTGMYQLLAHLYENRGDGIGDTTIAARQFFLFERTYWNL